MAATGGGTTPHTAAAAVSVVAIYAKRLHWHYKQAIGVIGTATALVDACYGRGTPLFFCFSWL